MVSGNLNATYTYNADGTRVKSAVTIGTVTKTTGYVGNYFEISVGQPRPATPGAPPNCTVPMRCTYLPFVGNGVPLSPGQAWYSYYYAGTSRIAMRIRSNQLNLDDALAYLLSDHLGGTTVTLDANGNQVAELRYSAWGETRYSNGTTPTQHKYTGQMEDQAGLYFYQARYYDPILGRFVSPDTLIPDPGSSLGWDRYSYARNNPILFNDPSGHDVGCSAADPKCQGQNNFTETDRYLLMKLQYAMWESSAYRGCFKCHAAVAYNQVALTNQQLETADQNMREWQAVGYTPMVATIGVVGSVEVLSAVAPVVSQTSPYLIGKAGVDQVLRTLNDPTAQTEVKVYVNEAGKRANLFARLDILTQTAIHEVKNVADLTLNQKFMEQAYRYKLIADSAGLELHYWLMNDAPQKVIDFLSSMGVIVHN